MSTITEFFGSPGLTSPNALPTIFSYCPTPGHEKPPNVGDSVVLISILVMRASAAAAASIAPAASTSAMFRGRAGFISSSPLSNTSAASRRRALDAERIAANVFRVLRKQPALARSESAGAQAKALLAGIAARLADVAGTVVAQGLRKCLWDCCSAPDDAREVGKREWAGVGNTRGTKKSLRLRPHAAPSSVSTYSPRTTITCLFCC